MASGVLLPFALLTRRPRSRALGRRGWGLCLLAGALLAGHFAAWVPSVTLTSVASSTALVATQPVWRRCWPGGRPGRSAARGLGRHPGRGDRRRADHRRDLTLSARAVAGDVLAVLGGILAAGYVTAGAAVRVRISTTAYTTVCYSACAVLLALVCLVFGLPLAGTPPAPGSSWPP